MWQQEWRNRDVVLDDLPLREARTRVEKLLGIGESDRAPPEPQRLLVRPRRRRPVTLNSRHRRQPAPDPRGTVRERQQALFIRQSVGAVVDGVNAGRITPSVRGTVSDRTENAH